MTSHPSRRSLLLLAVLWPGSWGCGRDEQMTGHPLTVSGAVKEDDDRHWSVVASTPGPAGTWRAEDVRTRIRYSRETVAVEVWDARPLGTGVPTIAVIGTGEDMLVPIVLEEPLGTRALKNSAGDEIGVYHWPIRGAQKLADDQHWRIFFWVWGDAETRWVRCEIVEQSEARLVIDVVDNTYPRSASKTPTSEKSLDIVLDGPLGGRPLVERMNGEQIPLRP